METRLNNNRVGVPIKHKQCKHGPGMIRNVAFRNQDVLQVDYFITFVPSLEA